jgi:hypothetical protein
MILFKKFTDKDILTILVELAIKDLPDESSGMLEARFQEDDSVEIYFIEKPKTLPS